MTGRKMINVLQGDFKGKLNSSKWAKMTGVHRDTALRDIQDLVDKGVLSTPERAAGVTKYVLLMPSQTASAILQLCTGEVLDTTRYANTDGFVDVRSGIGG